MDVIRVVASAALTLAIEAPLMLGFARLHRRLTGTVPGRRTLGLWLASAALGFVTGRWLL